MNNLNPECASSDEGAIVIDRLVVSYGSRRGVNGLTLNVPRGSVFALLGPNGAGKTTTIKTLLGFRFPTSGSARVLGFDITRQRPKINARIGFVSESNSLYLNMTIREIIAFCRATAWHWNQGMVEGYLRKFGLPINARVRQLSKGMRTQLALCLAFGNDPELLILDEPMTGLDPIARHAFLKVLMEEVAPTGKTVFFSTHILTDVEAVADHVGILRQGQLVLCSDLNELKRRYAQALIASANPLDEPQLHALSQIAGVTRVEQEGRSVRVWIQGDIDAAVAALRATNRTTTAVDVRNLTLEEIFLSLM